MTIAILNGPNLNMLGLRDAAVYGSQTLGDVKDLCAARCAEHGLDLDFFQSNSESALIEKIQESRRAQALIINAGAYSHTSIALRDALELMEGPIIEVHISNIHARETFRHHSHISAIATGLIVGLGVKGYGLAIDAAAEMIAGR